jgi:hypothetical protein
MHTFFRSLSMATLLLAVAATGASAQTSNSTGGLATPDYPAGFNNPALSGTLPAGTANIPAAKNPNIAGASGLSVVRGDRSTINGDRLGTIEQKAGSVSSSDASGG